MKTLIIRADDLGFSEAVNYGIEKSVKDGLIRTVGIMTNMPAAEHGLRLLEGEKICYGLHTNICVGRPLTDPKLIPSLVDEDGFFRKSSDYRKSKEDFVVLEEVILEIEAQYKRFVELTGKKPGYVEGHAVFSANFFRGLEIVAKYHNADYFGFSIDPEKRIAFRNSGIFAHMESIKADYDPEKAIHDVVTKRMHEDGVDLIICHPGYLDEYLLTHSSMTRARTQEVEMLCNPNIRTFLEKEEVHLITYDDVK